MQLCYVLQLKIYATIYFLPVCYYVHILYTVDIHVQKVLRAINDFAFVTTDYPLILSIENHVDK